MQDLTHEAAEGSSYKEGGDDLAALEAAGQGNGGEYNLQKEGAPDNLLVDYSPFYYLHAGTQVICGSQKHR